MRRCRHAAARFIYYDVTRRYVAVCAAFAMLPPPSLIFRCLPFTSRF